MPALKEGSFRIFYLPLMQNIKKLKGEKNCLKKFPKKPDDSYEKENKILKIQQKTK